MPRNMAFVTTILLVIASLMPLPLSEGTPSRGQTLETAMEEMQRANYFAFIMLLNMVSPDKLPQNITFLMPNNRMLAKAVIPKNSVLDFLLQHSIPTAISFEYLKHFPTGSIIPSSEPNFMLTVFNNGRQNFFLNNVKLVSPNICVAGSSIRCHGIDGVLLDMNNTSPLPVCPPLPLPTAPPPSSSGGGFDLAPGAAAQPTGSLPGPRNSGSFLWVPHGLPGHLPNMILFLLFCSYI